MRILFSLLILIITAITCFANDSSVAITPKGLEFKKETGVLLDQEILVISLNNIEIEYQFKNTTTKDIKTDVAFPIPEYGPEFSAAANGIPEFSEFKVQINNSPIHPERKISALVKGKNVTTILDDKKISILNFEKTEYGIVDINLEAFKKKIGNDFKTYISLGIISEDGFPQWTVGITYHWPMTFPAGKTTIIKHSYKPYTGYEYMYDEEMAQFSMPECLDNTAKIGIHKLLIKKKGVIKEWIPYILKTANNWQTPIKNFQLIVKKKPEQVVSLCSDRSFTKMTPTELRLTEKDYIPSKDLIVYFFTEMSQNNE